MRRILRVLLLVLAAPCTPSIAKSPDATHALVERAAIEETMMKYVWSVDSLDADGYVSVFTEDAVIDSNGSLIKGHDAIRKVVTDLEALYERNRAAGKPAGRLYHVISNERIVLADADSATYYSYWQTMRRGPDGRYAAGGFGRSEDHLVKRDGRWLIQLRKLTVYTE
jgi:ketosteroid isomerase-like protein